MFDNAERKRARLLNKVADTMSVRTYNIALGILVLYGFIVNAIIVSVADDFFLRISPVVFLIGYFISALIGCILSAVSSNPFVSFVGYNFVVVPIGALLSICLRAYELGDVFSAIAVTGFVVAVMLLWAIIMPNFFAGMGRTLFFSLLIGIIAEFVAHLMGYGGDIFNWFFVIIFSLYIGYDWCKAQSYSKTLDNAVDSALDIYLDIINLFIRILEIMGKSKNDD
jgi:FtsH-binding integral membrane protein